MDRRRHQRGFLLIVAIVLLVVASILAATMAFMVATSGSSASDNLRSAQALFLADSGLEYEQRQLAQNVDWYRATSDPFDVPPSPINVGQGSFTVVVNLPATELRTRLNAGSGAATANVFAGGSGTRWPAPSGTLLIGDDFTSFDAEFVTYTATSAGTFSINARNTRIPAAGGVFNSNAAVGTGFDHVRGDNVYPVTTLSGATPALPLASSCSVLTNLQIAANSKFLRGGTLTVYHGSGASPEQITYTNSTTVGGTTTLTGLTRCANGTSFVAAASGDPVVSMVVNAGTNDLEVSISSTGNAGSTQRQEYKAVQRQR